MNETYSVANAGKLKRFFFKLSCFVCGHNVLVEFKIDNTCSYYENIVFCGDCGKIFKTINYSALDVILIDEIKGIGAFHSDVAEGLPWREKRKFIKAIGKTVCQTMPE